MVKPNLLPKKIQVTEKDPDAAPLKPINNNATPLKPINNNKPLIPPHGRSLKSTPWWQAVTTYLGGVATTLHVLGPLIKHYLMEVPNAFIMHQGGDQDIPAFNDWVNSGASITGEDVPAFVDRIVTLYGTDAIGLSSEQGFNGITTYGQAQSEAAFKTLPEAIAFWGLYYGYKQYKPQQNSTTKWRTVPKQTTKTSSPPKKIVPKQNRNRHPDRRRDFRVPKPDHRRDFRNPKNLYPPQSTGNLDEEWEYLLLHPSKKRKHR